MKDLIRVVLVDPNEESRDALQRLLEGSARSGSPKSSPATRTRPRRAGEISPT